MTAVYGGDVLPYNYIKQNWQDLRINMKKFNGKNATFRFQITDEELNVIDLNSNTATTFTIHFFTYKDMPEKLENYIIYKALKDGEK